MDIQAATVDHLQWRSRRPPQSTGYNQIAKEEEESGPMLEDKKKKESNFSGSLMIATKGKKNKKKQQKETVARRIFEKRAFWPHRLLIALVAGKWPATCCGGQETTAT